MISYSNWLVFALLIIPAVLDFVLAIFSILFRKTATNIVFALFSFFVGMWTFGLCLFGLLDLQRALFWNKIFIFSAGFIPATFLHFSFLFNNKSVRLKHLFLFYFPAFLVGFLLWLYPEGFIKKIVQQSWGKESILGDLYLYYGLYFSMYTMYAVGSLFLRMKHVSGILRERYKFILIATLPAFTAGAWFDLVLILLGNYKYIWLGPYFTCGFVLITSYAIIRYRLMDIRVVAASTIILIFVYIITIGVPFYLYSKGLSLFALILMGVLATLGPSIYLYLQRRANEALLKEQKQYQKTLIQASSGMGRIKDIQKLLKLIVRIIIRVVRLEHCSVYVLDKSHQVYLLGGSLAKKGKVALPGAIPTDSAVIQQMVRFKKIVVSEEENQRLDAERKQGRSALCMDLSALQAVLVVPSMMDDRLVGFLVLGAKVSGKHFSEDDLSVFTILANQSALAIENALFYEDVKRTQEQLFKAEKMATIGTMADGLSHQINNRLHAMGFIAGDMQDTLSVKKSIFNSPELQELEKEFAYGLSRLQENVTRGGEVVQGLMKYTRKGDEGQAPCDVNKVFDSAHEMVQFKIKTGQMKIVKDYDPSSLPMVKGNFTQLQEVFFNLIDNAYDAMMQRKNEHPDADYQPLLTINVSAEAGKVRIVFADNGIGVKEEDKHKLFTPFFTTKASAKKGTGLGLYVIRKIIEDNHGGHVDVDSKYMIGTRMVLMLFAT